MKRKEVRLIGYCLAAGLMIVLATVMAACSSKSATTAVTSTTTAATTSAVQTTTSAPLTTTSAPVTTSKPAATTTTAAVTSTTAPKTTTTAAFPYQGSGSGVWSGQITYNNKPYSIAGTMSVAVDANGVFSGSISDSSGGTAPTTINAKVDANGNLTGTVSFVIGTTTFVTTWQGKMTASGTALSLQGTWTSQYGSGTFSGTGTSSK